METGDGSPRKAAAKSLLEGVQEFHTNPEFSDFTIVCGNCEWKVHRMVLALHSKVLAKACSGEFKEATKRKIDLSEHLPECVDGLVHYMYKLQYVEDPDTTMTSLVYDVHMCILADKYDIPPLKAMAIQKFQQTAKNASHYGYFAHAALLAYEASTATRAICDTIVKYGIEEKALITRAGADKTPLRKVMETTRELAADYAAALEARNCRKNEMRFRCAKCKGVFQAEVDRSHQMRCPYCNTAWCFMSTWLTHVAVED